MNAIHDFDDEDDEKSFFFLKLFSGIFRRALGTLTMPTGCFMMQLLSNRLFMFGKGGVTGTLRCLSDVKVIYC